MGGNRYGINARVQTRLLRRVVYDVHDLRPDQDTAGEIIDHRHHHHALAPCVRHRLMRQVLAPFTLRVSGASLLATSTKYSLA